MEETLLLDDVLIDNGTIYDSVNKSVGDTMTGRFGNIMLINGDSNYSRKVRQNEVVRFFITNAANTRVFNFTIPGVKMKLVGADGGKYDYETWVDSVVLGPSERAVVEVLFNYGKYSLVNKTPNRSYVLGTVEVFDNKATLYNLTFETLRGNPDTKSDHDNFIQSKRRTLNKELRLFMRTDMGMGMGGMSMMSMNPNPILWDDIGSMMNIMGNSGMVKWNIQDAQTGNIKENIKWNFKVGDRVKIKIQNNTRQGFQMQHPIHFHGQRFLVTAINGVKNNNMVWKDTVLIPYGSTSDSYKWCKK